MLGTWKAIGDIDGATGPAFSAALRDTIDSADQTLVSVDCSGVTFMDPAGYHALVDATRYAARRGHTLVIRNMSPSCTRLIRLYAWDRALRVEPSFERAQMVIDALFFSGDSRTHPRRGLSELPFSSSHLVERGWERG